MTDKELKTKQDILEKLDRMFESALNHPTWTSWREHAVKCIRYKEGKQWTKEELAILKERKQPATVNNQVSVTVNHMLGQFIKTKTRTKLRGRNSPTDDKTASALSSALLFIHQNNDEEFEEREVAEDGFTTGFGCFETDVTFDTMANPEIRVRHVDSLEILPDPYSRRYDWNEDARFVCRQKWVNVDIAAELYPEHKRELRAFANGFNGAGELSGVDELKNNNYIDHEKHENQIRIVECWYKVQEKKILFIDDNGDVAQKDDLTKKQIAKIKKDGARELTRLETTMKIGVFTGNILLEHKETDITRFKYVPYFINRMKSGEPYSNILIALSMQDAINKRESKALHLLSKDRIFYEKGAIENKNVLADEMAQPDGQIEVSRLDKILVDKNIELAVSQFSLHQSAKSDFKQIVGINPESLGEKSEIRSGVGIARKQAASGLTISPALDNFRKTRNILERNKIELIQKYWTQKKVFMVTDNLNNSKEIVLNANENEAAALKQATFDVIQEEIPDTTTVQQEQFQTLSQVLPQILPFGPFWTRMLLQLSDIQNKEEILEQMADQGKPPPTTPNINISAQLSELSAEERAFFYQKMGSDEMAQLVAQSGKDSAHVVKAKVELQKESLRQEESDENREVEKSKVLSDFITKGQQNANRNSNPTR